MACRHIIGFYRGTKKTRFTDNHFSFCNLVNEYNNSVSILRSTPQTLALVACAFTVLSLSGCGSSSTSWPSIPTATSNSSDLFSVLTAQSLPFAKYEKHGLSLEFTFTRTVAKAEGRYVVIVFPPKTGLISVRPGEYALTTSDGRTFQPGLITVGYGATPSNLCRLFEDAFSDHVSSSGVLAGGEGTNRLAIAFDIPSNLNSGALKIRDAVYNISW